MGGRELIATLHLDSHTAWIDQKKEPYLIIPVCDFDNGRGPRDQAVSELEQRLKQCC